MNYLFAFAILLCVFSAAISAPLHVRPVVNEFLIQKINTNPQSTWKAGVNWRFINRTLNDAKKLLGWIPNPENKLGVREIPVSPSIPVEFNSAIQWPKCKTIPYIYDQAECGSCWAFGCVEAVSDRFCISSNASINFVFSFEDEVSCGPCDGCEGGDADSAWGYVQQSGLVTGTCYPYNIPTCPPSQEPCLNFVPTPPCQQSCQDSETWAQSKHFLSNAYDVSSDNSQIQTEIMTHGPVEVCFTVYEDFLNYKSGVYQYQSGDALGGHCVKMIGWGVENGTPYWLCNNSWTNYWGFHGQFKIIRGQDECGIEDNVVAGTPQV